MNKFTKNLTDLIMEKDPAAKSRCFVKLYHPNIKVQRYHRLANILYHKNHHFLANVLSNKAKKKTAIEIHPGATLGENLFIDHGIGIVIGETSIIKDNVTIYHGVTLGGHGKSVNGRRHPIIEDDVLIGANATILGPITIGKGAKIGAGAVVLKDVPAGATVVGMPGRILEK